MTNLLDTQILADGRYAWFVFAYEATDANPVRHWEYRIEVEGCKDIVFSDFNEAKRKFEEMVLDLKPGQKR
jgi:hypothetical protein